MRDSHQRIFEEVKKELAEDSSGHDPQHVKRVYNNAMSIAEQEGGDKDVIGAASLVHDLHRIIGGDFTHPADSIYRVNEVLERAGYEGDVHKVVYCVAVHEDYEFEEGVNEEYGVEAQIVQDADNLDAIGALGIGRTFKFGGAYGNPMWQPEIDGENQHSYHKENLDDSTVQHFYDKLLKLKDNMNTETAQKQAKEQHEFMKEFLKRFKKSGREKTNPPNPHIPASHALFLLGSPVVLGCF